MRARIVVLLSFGVAAAAAPRSADAIPAFARRYGVDCVFCHDGFPKLNSLGLTFKAHGFRLEREDAFDAGRWIRSGPAVLRGSLTRSFVEGGRGSTAALGKVISAGNLGRRLSYWVDDGFSIASGDVTHTKPDNAWVRVEALTGGKLYLRGGRMEMDLPFTLVRTPHLFGYDVYFANAGLETDSFARHREGVELGGDLPADVRWSAALVEGHEQAPVSGFHPAVFLRLSKALARNRLGAFAYLGKSELSLDGATTWPDHVLRVGADGIAWLGRLNLYGLYLHGRNDNPIATVAQPAGTAEALSFDGGFAQADYHARGWLILTLRANAVRRPPGVEAEPNVTFASLYPGIQVFILEHGKVSFEYGFENRGRPGIGALQAEFAF